MQKYLEIQRASAGSGKTYSLAKKFLWLFLTIRTDDDTRENYGQEDTVTLPVMENGPSRRLRTRAELRDSLRHILAVTFTNKATNEMQQRIVEKLFQLAFSKKTEKIDYLLDFCKMLKGSEEINDEDIRQFRNVCRQAIYILLENYSDFQVSTIDSFFQLVLRTFAYETELNDSYGIELDSEFLSKMGIDSIFEDIEEGRASSEVTFWLNKMMDNSRNSGNGWNIFQRRESKGPYSEFISSLKKLQNEDFKDIRGTLEDYFRNNPDFISLYEDLYKKYDSIPAAPHKKMLKLAAKVKALTGQWKTEPLPSFIGNLQIHAEKTLTYKSVYKLPAGNNTYKPKTDENFDGSTAQKLRNTDTGLFDELRRVYTEMINCKSEWLNALESPEYRHWSLYKKQFPLMGLLSVTLRKREEYLEENNNVELSETNSLLHRIIGKDDTPFIYERLGTKLNHFLIDEFQDTSRLQWENFKPLLDESIGRGQENLLIGDAKQSIYRFRNADPSLISYKVQQTYPGLTPVGDAPKENTNHRSDHNVVNFNNRLFRFLSSSIEDEKTQKMNGKAFSPNFNFKELYSNVVQNFKNNNETGHISLNFIKSNTNDYPEVICSRLITCIEDILSRGFSMGDIAILVDRNVQADMIIQAFLEYNSNEKNRLKLEFISEESLKLRSSPAVSVILSTLETISRGTDPEIVYYKDSGRRSVNWDQIRSNFRLYCMKNRDKDVAEALEEFLKEGSGSDAIAEMLSSMQAVTLPALVEGITASFLSDDIRHENAPYIAAFQDTVLEYCEAYPSDIPSFLDWWEKRKEKFSISSPEGMDAIKVMTIHKSKGLEFSCVLVPFANCSFINTNPRKKEWSWVVPDIIYAEGHKLPPYIPVDTDSSLTGTSHEDRLWKYVEMSTMDNLNKLYVAFTRAVHELYIFCQESTKPASNSFTSMLKIFIDGEEIKFNRISESDDTSIYTTGEKWTPLELESLKDRESKEKKGNNTSGTIILDDYNSTATPSFVKYREEDAPDIIDADNVSDEDLDNDPRSEGNIFHAIMQRIRVPEDIPSAVTYLRRKGYYSPKDAEDIISFLREKLNRPEIKGWFDKSNRIINERSIIDRSKIERPDRIIIDKNRNAVIIDYKFGEKMDDSKYGAQVRGYVNKLKETGKFLSVKGYIWYVKLNRILFVSE